MQNRIRQIRNFRYRRRDLRRLEVEVRLKPLQTAPQQIVARVNDPPAEPWDDLAAIVPGVPLEAANLHLARAVDRLRLRACRQVQSLLVARELLNAELLDRDDLARQHLRRAAPVPQRTDNARRIV